MTPGGGAFGEGAFGDEGGPVQWPQIQDTCTATDALRLPWGIVDACAPSELLRLYTNSTLIVTLGGVDISTRVRKYETSITLANGSTPSSASVLLRSRSGAAIVPLEGQRLTITLGPDQTTLFDGQIVTVSRTQARAAAKPVYRLECVDWTFQFDMDYVVQDYVNKTPNEIITDVLTKTSGFTDGDVESGLSWLNAVSSLQQSYRFQRPSEVLQAVATRTGSLFRVQFSRSVYLRTTNTIPTPLAINASNAKYKKLSYVRDIKQARTLVDAVGSGSVSLPIPMAPNATVLPVTSAYPFALPAGVASAQAQLSIPATSDGLASLLNIAYTGTLRSGTISAPSDTRLSTAGVTSVFSGGNLKQGMYRWAFSYETANGETPLSRDVSALTPAGSYTAALSFVDLYDTINAGSTRLPPDRSITGIKIYRTRANGSQFFLVTTITSTSNNLFWPTSYSDTTADSSLGAAAPASVSICPAGPTSSAISASTATTLTVVDATRFDQAGGYAYLNGVLIAYTSVSDYVLSGGNVIAGKLNFASSAVLTSTTFIVGDTITATPVLTGVTGSTAVSPSSPAASPQQGSITGVGPTLSTKYNWATTFVSAAGESLPSALSPQFCDAFPTVPTALAATNKGSLTGPTNGATYSWRLGWIDTRGILAALSSPSNALVSNGTAAHLTWSSVAFNFTTLFPVLFRTKANGSTYYLSSWISFGGSTNVDDNTADGSLTILMTDYWVQAFALKEIPIGPTGTTSRKLYRNTGPSTALQLVTTIADNTTTTYTDQTADGSLGAAPPSTDTSALTGMPALPASTTVSIATQIGDTAAQTALAASEDSSGIHRFRVASSAPDVTSLLQQATAELDAGKSVIETLSYVCEDPLSQPNAQVTVDLSDGPGPAISTTLTIQRVGISWVEGRRMPQFAVTASNQYNDIYQYLSQTAQKAQTVAA